MAGSYQGFGSQQQTTPYSGWNQSLPYTGSRNFNPGYSGGGINPSANNGMMRAMPAYQNGGFNPGMNMGGGGMAKPGQPPAGFIPGQQIGQGMQGPGGGFGPQPPMAPGGFDPIAAQNDQMAGAGNVTVDPSLARMRVQQGVMGGGGYSMQDMADAGMGSQDLNSMIQSFRAGNLSPVNMTGQQATGLQQAANLRAAEYARRFNPASLGGLLGMK